MEKGYKSCPYCAETICEAATVCRYCNRTLGDLRSSLETKSPTIPIVAKNPWRAILSIVVLVALSLIFFWGYTHSQQGDSNLAGSIETMQWNEITRKTIVSQTIDLQGLYGWSKDSFPTDRTVKMALIVHCAASDSSRVVFAVMDQENITRMQGGYPAFVLYSSAITKPIQVDTPQGKPYWFGFVEPGEKPSQPGAIPTDKFGALIYLIDAYERGHRPPVRLTVQIDTIVSYFSTAAEARRQQELLRQAARESRKPNLYR